MKTRILITSCAALLAPLATELHAQLVLTGDLQFASEGGSIGVGNLATSGTAFSSSDLGAALAIPFHRAFNVNDATFGNSNSWIGDNAGSFVGIGFGSAQSITSFAFGRDNTIGGLVDRAVGLYTVQYTTGANPAVDFAMNTWTTIGTISLNTDTIIGVTNPALRHRFNFNPVTATGFRLIVPGVGIANGAAIDELELFATPGAVTPPTPPIGITPAPGFSVTWDGNDGDNFSASGVVPNNLALAANAAVPFSSGDLGQQIMVPFHVTSNLNDGRYGNSFSWIGGDGAPAPFHAGVLLEDLYEITSIAWGRDNGLDVANGDCCGGQLTDRSLGTYTIQRTLDGLAWETVGSVNYNYSQDATLGGGFTSHFRHEFELSDGSGGILAMGMRILVPQSGLSNGGTAIDEIELYGTPIPEPGSAALLLGGLGFLAARRRRRD